MRFLYERAKLACEPAGAAALRRCEEESPAPRRQNGRRRRHGRQRLGRNGCCHPGLTVKPDIHPEYVTATVCCPGNEFETRSTRPGAARRDLLELPSVLYGQAEAAGHGWTRRALPTPARARRWRPPRPVLGRGHVGTQGVSSPRGRDDAQPFGLVVIVRKPDGEIAQLNHEINSVMARHRVFRLLIIRGVIALGESLAIGFRALAIRRTTRRRRKGTTRRSRPRSGAAR